MENRRDEIIEDFLTSRERSRLVSFCRKLTGDPDIAEDLAQETLFLAWRHIEMLRDPTKRSQWIAGIARNVSLNWLRQHGREMTHRVTLSQHAEALNVLALDELVPDGLDLETELEHKELIDLLERAVALLPKETQTILIKRYVEELPLAEIAEQLYTKTSTVTMRLQRGKLALQKILTGKMQQEILTYQANATAQTWEHTSLWCNICGKHRLLGRKQPDQGLLYLKCPACSPDDNVLSKSESLPQLKGIKSFKPAYGHLLEWCHTYYRRGLREGSVMCDTCGKEISVKISMPEEIHGLHWLNKESPIWTSRQHERLVNIVCPHCRAVHCISLSGLALSLPEGRAFLHAKQRIHLLPYRSIEFAGRSAIVTTFECVTDTTRFEVISDDETYAVLKIYGGSS